MHVSATKLTPAVFPTHDAQGVILTVPIAAPITPIPVIVLSAALVITQQEPWSNPAPATVCAVVKAVAVEAASLPIS